MPPKPLSATENGNAFILVAVACLFFGALCYVVINTGSTGALQQEKDLMSAAQITQYPATLRTTVRRMIADGVAAEALNFDPADATASGVFSAMGGQTAVQDPPAGIGANSAWRFKTAPNGPDGQTGWFIGGVGSDGPRGKDVFAYLDHLSLDACTQILRGLALPDTPLIEPQVIDFTGTAEGTPVQSGGAAGPESFSRAEGKHSFNAWLDHKKPQSYACVQNGAGGDYIYYHVLVDR